MQKFFDEDKDSSEKENSEEQMLSDDEEDVMKNKQPKDIDLDDGHPTAMPILSKNITIKGYQEPNVFRLVGFYKRKKENEDDEKKEGDSDYDEDIDKPQNGHNQNGAIRCKHREIINFKCSNQLCDYTLQKFGSMFDSGRIPCYIRVLYMSDTEALMQPFENKKDMIYMSYTPTNIIQMRDFNLYLIHKSIKAYKKRCEQMDDVPEFMNYVLHKDIPTNTNQSTKFQDYITMYQDQKENIMASHSLFIDSLFESGNIERVYKYRGLQEYDLFMNVDTNTRGHQQWFYFRVRNMKANQKYRFHIKNFTKGQSLYRKGMNLMWRSKQKCQEQGLYSEETEGWEFIPEDYLDELIYHKSTLEREPKINSKYKKLFEEAFPVPPNAKIDDPTPGGKDGKKKGQQNQPGKVEIVNKNADKQGGKGKNKEKKDDNEDNENNYFQIQMQKKGKQSFYELTFTLEFENDKDTVYIAYSVPYTYTRLFMNILKTEHELRQLDYKKPAQQPDTTETPKKKDEEEGDDGKQPNAQKFDAYELGFNEEVNINVNNKWTYNRKLMCLSLSGLPVPIITITSVMGQGIPMKRRQGIFLTSRIHPGETNASFAFDGFYNYITSTKPGPQWYVRENCVIKMVPVLNPDGVVCGNYRSSLAGVDLNRQWVAPNQYLHPTIFYIKRVMSVFSKQRNFLWYCDLHGHSRKKNAFIYGCNKAANGGFNSWTKVRLYPRILARNTGYFSIKDCKFKVEKGKLGTGRVVVWKEFGVTNSFTLENSFYGYTHGEDVLEFSSDEFREIGYHLLKGLHEYLICLVDIQKELNLTRGWLKPKLLLEITGMTAQEKVMKDLQEQKKKEKRARIDALLAEKQNKLTQGSIMKGKDDEEEEEEVPAKKAFFFGLEPINEDKKKPLPKPDQINPFEPIVERTLTTQKSLQPNEPLSFQGLVDHYVKKDYNSQKQLEVLTKKEIEQNEAERLTYRSSDDTFHTKHYRRNIKKLIKVQAYTRMFIQKRRYKEMLQDNQQQSIFVYEQVSKQSSKANLDIKDKLKSKQISQKNILLKKRSERIISPQSNRQSNANLPNMSAYHQREGPSNSFYQVQNTGRPRSILNKNDKNPQDEQTEQASISQMNPMTVNTNLNHPVSHTQNTVNTANIIANNHITTQLNQQRVNNTSQNQGTAQGINAGQTNNTHTHNQQNAMVSQVDNETQKQYLEMNTNMDMNNISDNMDDLSDGEPNALQRKLRKLTQAVTQNSMGQINPEFNSLESNEKLLLKWRHFFSEEELIDAFEKILRGEDPNDEEEDSGSDSNPSEDNLDFDELYDVIYLEKKQKAEVREQKQTKEKQFIKHFAKYVSKQVKRIHRKESMIHKRDASLDSNNSLSRPMDIFRIRKQRKLKILQQKEAEKKQLLDAEEDQNVPSFNDARQRVNQPLNEPKFGFRVQKDGIKLHKTALGVNIKSTTNDIAKPIFFDRKNADKNKPKLLNQTSGDLHEGQPSNTKQKPPNSRLKEYSFHHDGQRGGAGIHHSNQNSFQLNRVMANGQNSQLNQYATNKAGNVVDSSFDQQSAKSNMLSNYQKQKQRMKQYNQGQQIDQQSNVSGLTGNETAKGDVESVNNIRKRRMRSVENSFCAQQQNAANKQNANIKAGAEKTQDQKQLLSLLQDGEGEKQIQDFISANKQKFLMNTAVMNRGILNQSELGNMNASENTPQTNQQTQVAQSRSQERSSPRQMQNSSMMDHQQNMGGAASKFGQKITVVQNIRGKPGANQNNAQTSSLLPDIKGGKTPTIQKSQVKFDNQGNLSVNKTSTAHKQRNIQIIQKNTQQVIPATMIDNRPGYAQQKSFLGSVQRPEPQQVKINNQDKVLGIKNRSSVYTQGALGQSVLNQKMVQIQQQQQQKFNTAQKPKVDEQVNADLQGLQYSETNAKEKINDSSASPQRSQVLNLDFEHQMEDVPQYIIDRKQSLEQMTFDEQNQEASFGNFLNTQDNNITQNDDEHEESKNQLQARLEVSNQLSMQKQMNSVSQQNNYATQSFGMRKFNPQSQLMTPNKQVNVQSLLNSAAKHGSNFNIDQSQDQGITGGKFTATKLNISTIEQSNIMMKQQNDKLNTSSVQLHHRRLISRKNSASAVEIQDQLKGKNLQQSVLQNSAINESLIVRRQGTSINQNPVNMSIQQPISEFKMLENPMLYNSTGKDMTSQQINTRNLRIDTSTQQENSFTQAQIQTSKHNLIQDDGGTFGEKADRAQFSSQIQHHVQEGDSSKHSRKGVSLSPKAKIQQKISDQTPKIGNRQIFTSGTASKVKEPNTGGLPPTSKNIINPLQSASTGPNQTNQSSSNQGSSSNQNPSNSSVSKKFSTNTGGNGSSTVMSFHPQSTQMTNASAGGTSNETGPGSANKQIKPKFESTKPLTEDEIKMEQLHAFHQRREKQQQMMQNRMQNQQIQIKNKIQAQNQQRMLQQTQGALNSDYHTMNIGQKPSTSHDNRFGGRRRQQLQQRKNSLTINNPNIVENMNMNSNQVTGGVAHGQNPNISIQQQQQNQQVFMQARQHMHQQQFSHVTQQSSGNNRIAHPQGVTKLQQHQIRPSSTQQKDHPPSNRFNQQL